MTDSPLTKTVHAKSIVLMPQHCNVVFFAYLNEAHILRFKLATTPSCLHMNGMGTAWFVLSPSISINNGIAICFVHCYNNILQHADCELCLGLAALQHPHLLACTRCTPVAGGEKRKTNSQQGTSRPSSAALVATRIRRPGAWKEESADEMRHLCRDFN